MLLKRSRLRCYGRDPVLTQFAGPRPAPAATKSETGSSDSQRVLRQPQGPVMASSHRVCTKPVCSGSADNHPLSTRRVAVSQR
eukprot:1789250-Prymnesium_polylepis.1